MIERGETGKRGDLRAHELLRGAYDAGYRFEPGFKGFRAAFLYRDDRRCETGALEVRSPGSVRPGGGLGAGAGRVRREMSSMVGHRFNLSCDEADGRYPLSLGEEEHPLGCLVKVDDPFESSYRVLCGRISQVNRTLENLWSSIRVQNLLWTGTCNDSYVVVDDACLPLARQVVRAQDTGTAVRQLLLKDHELPGGGRDGLAGAANAGTTDLVEA